MGFLSRKVARYYLNAGDHIYTWRTGFVYAHHGIYKDDGQVVHFTCPKSASSAPLKRRRESCSTCEKFEHSDRDSGVIISCLDCFLKKGKLYRHKYGVKKTTHRLSRRGTCNTAKSDPAEVVMARVELKLANGFGEYDLLDNNCEDFATYCKTGQKCKRTGQASIIPQEWRSHELILGGAKLVRGLKGGNPHFFGKGISYIIDIFT
ncbi:protein LEAD-SENSITIVE 1-like [Salvia miltiorrhiza]|uniref:protein LEAD-SENSITIVE 1-like n=1 Tax=Salvia miltiorrhiza TaxID=226208 RepID=UPI0025ACE332|nr:protein LEAD-SENSITIVE 1-like [Salvia miltiorrhiza]